MQRRQLRRNYPLLHVLSVAPPENISTILPYLNSDTANVLSECVRQIYCGCVKVIPPQERAKLREALLPVAPQIRALLKKRTVKGRKKALVQVGGTGLSVILGALLPAIAALLAPKN